MENTRLPNEIIDNILLYLPVQISISLKREYPKRKLLAKVSKEWTTENLELIKWLHKYNIEGCTTHAMDLAAQNGDLEIVKWLHINRTEGCTTNAMDWAAEQGHFDVVKFLHENRKEGCTSDAMNLAAQNGHLEIVKWFYKNRTEGNTAIAMDYAAFNGHIPTLEWFYDEFNYDRWPVNIVEWFSEKRSTENTI